MKAYLRKLCREQPFLYRCYILIRFKKELRLPDSHTQLVMEGYPRSGNTYARYLIETSFPDLRFTSHVHTIAALKRAVRLDCPVVVLLRKPEEAISSYCCKYDIGCEDLAGISQTIQDYIDFYEGVLNLKKYKIVDFDSIVESPVSFLELLSGWLGLTCSRAELDRAIVSATEAMQLKESQKKEMGSSLPTAVRRERKAAIKEKVVGSEKFPDALRLFKILRSSIIESEYHNAV